MDFLIVKLIWGLGGGRLAVSLVGEGSVLAEDVISDQLHLREAPRSSYLLQKRDRLAEQAREASWSILSSAFTV